ncbi:hypothetical protein BX666DRAFT_1858098 [Dichotomocladium elegans]|nr:hypothetical protein BX666DRAFT_1858098 [Dichotomocladium elegans]
MTGKVPSAHLFVTRTFSNRSCRRIASNYIVTFSKDTPPEVIDQEVEKAKASGANVKHVYKTALKGYAVQVPDDLVTALDLSHPNILAVEAEGEVTIQGQSLLRSAP